MKRVRILIIEDQSSVRSVLRCGLIATGYLVAEASNGSDAMEIVQDEPPDIVLLDLSMPVMHGMVFLAELAQMDPAPPTRVIVMTAHRSTPLVVEAMKLGARDFLVKPVTYEELTARISSLLSEMQPVAS